VIDSGIDNGGIASSVVLLELAMGCEAASAAAWDGRDDLEVDLRGGIAMVIACAWEEV
jgi:hypothetical protein